MKKPKGEYSIQTVTNALRVLDAFRDAEDFGVTELAKKLGLHKNNVFRLLATLEQLQFVEQARDDRYRLGARTLELGQAFLRSRGLLRKARAALEELTAESRETTHLSLLRDFEVVFVDGVVAGESVVAASRVGQRLPAHCTAPGKVLLGCAGDDVREGYDRGVIAGGGLVKRTPNTIVDPHKFFEHLRSVAVQGFAVDLEECEPGLSGAAAPVYEASGALAGALAVSGPVFRLDEDHLLRKVVPWVTAAAERLSRDLGYAT